LEVIWSMSLRGLPRAIDALARAKIRALRLPRQDEARMMRPPIGEMGRERGGVMANNDDALVETAATAGLTRLDQAHLVQLERAVEAARELGGKLPKDLHYSEEIALTFRLPTGEGSRP
jgi:hypothetical protein